ncbi:MAG TPA: succinyl-diaminopimelate desuccinylase [Glycomyces sp.]|nr:succinyl-diaminopimelate desuccinylase [Glycomyces sp.]
MNDLLELTAELVAIPSVSGDEARIVAAIEGRLAASAPHLKLVRLGDSLVAVAPPRGTGRRIVLAGHVDTVPGEAGVPDAPEDTVTGRGAVDMKGGVAVMIALAERSLDSPHDLTFVFYDREELGSHQSGMHRISRDHADLLEGDLAVVLEPTGAVAEVGCQGNLVVDLVFTGRRAHSGRPWQGENAVHKALAAGGRIAAHPTPPVTVEGHRYRPSISVVGVSGGVQGNVIPDRAALKVNYRHPPTVTTEEAVKALLRLAPEAESHEVALSSPPAPPSTSHPMLKSWMDRRGIEARPKLGWTDLGRFAQLGIPAVNFGPGDPELAHSPDEIVSAADLSACFAHLADLLGIDPAGTGDDVERSTK